MDSNTQENNDYQFLLFYVYHLIKEPTEICVTVETECKQLKMGGRVRISSEGSNGIVGGSSLSISQFKESFSTITCIESSLVHWFQSGLVASIPVNQQVFSSLSIQVTKEVVSLDVKSDMYGKLIATGAGTYLTPQEFHAMLGTLDKSTSSRKSSSLDSSTLEHTSNFELLDIRNHYEVRIGTFSGDSFVATNPETRQVIYLFIAFYYVCLIYFYAF